jgi:hemerythrin superfamily protein
MLEQYEQEHNRILEEINAINLDSASPFEISKVAYLYTQARVIAFKIAGHYKAEYKHYEAQAEVQQGLGYKLIRRKEHEEYRDLTTAADAQYLSRITKGKQLDLASKSEGLYTQWKGIADTYQDSRNALKDVLDAIKAEGGSNHASHNQRTAAIS